MLSVFLVYRNNNESSAELKLPGPRLLTAHSRVIQLTTVHVEQPFTETLPSLVLGVKYGQLTLEK